MVIFQYITFIFVALILLKIGIKGILHPRKTRENLLQKNEKSWYYTKTKIGRLSLKSDKESKTGILENWLGSLGVIIFGLLILYLIINDIFQNSLPK